jgi:hypothetical protein
MMFKRNTDSAEEVLRGDLTDGAQLYEFAVFLGLIVPSMLFSFFAVKTGSVSFVLTAWATLARDLSLIGLVLFFFWRNGEPVTRIGWTLRRPIKEIALGMVFAFVYLWRGSLVAAMAMHFLQDFTGILLLPLLFGH